MEDCSDQFQQDPRGYLYLVQLREHVIRNESVFKVGMTQNIIERFKQYPNGSALLFVSQVCDRRDAEKMALQALKRVCTQRLDLGHEYFEAAYGALMSILLEVVKEKAKGLNPLAHWRHKGQKSTKAMARETSTEGGTIRVEETSMEGETSKVEETSNAEQTGSEDKDTTRSIAINNSRHWYLTKEPCTVSDAYYISNVEWPGSVRYAVWTLDGNTFRAYVEMKYPCLPPELGIQGLSASILRSKNRGERRAHVLERGRAWEYGDWDLFEWMNDIIGVKRSLDINTRQEIRALLESLR